MKINDLSARIDTNMNVINAAIQRVISSGYFILGPEVKRFEKAFADYLDVPYCIGLANGTDAIELALKSVEIQKDDIVATVANAGMYTTTAILGIGAQPFFLDVDLKTHNTTLTEVMRAIDAGVKAVVVTHLYGLATPQINEIAAYCEKKNVALIEDCAQAHGASIHGKRVGTFGDAASFSFYPTKNLGALGDGGAIITKHSDIAEKILRLRQYGWSDKYKVEVPGARNSRLDEIQAAILNALLPNLDEDNGRRRRIASQYIKRIKHPDIILPEEMKYEYVAHLFVLRTNRRDELRNHLKNVGISTEIHYPIPDHNQPIIHEMFRHLTLENTELLAKEILTLPCYPEMSDEQINLVIEGVNSWL
ncbi:DegT/DnrJ/EryC1/StrS family aminotransferase [Legionella fallonii]|uniref:Glutamine--scyllo-inositol transaminase n=1 Tax=Legionella fallonii LLAP-10 TaxID=1212491 RepID=A0A098G912_9GAMM|nr:DegT/DnrJ/EryC1/StrS family aminotransferase [Legionella fallonii]CEG58989.1 Glutamine--scyllo-inositol transaminase [Legionella fallonii LLAP-10]